jgi:hypothetical protein
MDDLVKRLRDPSRGGGGDAFEAANEIDRLKARVNWLADTLKSLCYKTDEDTIRKIINHQFHQLRKED